MVQKNAVVSELFRNVFN